MNRQLTIFILFVLVVGTAVAANQASAETRARPAVALPSPALDADRNHNCRALQRASRQFMGPVASSLGIERAAHTELKRRDRRRLRRFARQSLRTAVDPSSVSRGCYRCIVKQYGRASYGEHKPCGAHDICVEGMALHRSSDSCVAAICDDQSRCCRKRWNSECVEAAGTVCHDPCEPCSHGVCDFGGPLSSECGACEQAVCEQDPYCCDTLWDRPCVEAAEELCLMCTDTTTTTAAPVTTTTITVPGSTLPPSTTTTTLSPSSCDTIIDFESLAAGEIVDAISATDGAGPIGVFANNPKLPGDNAAVIFDSSCRDGCSGNDRDLGTPNRDFSGPGLGKAGRAGGANPNQVALGNVLIVAADLKDSNGNGRVDQPNDQAHRKVSIDLDFSSLGSVQILGMTVLDVEATEVAPTVELIGADGSAGGRFVLPNTGNNGVVDAAFDEAGLATTVRITLRGSAAIDNIRFRRSGSDCNGTTTTTMAPTTTTTLAPTTTTTMVPTTTTTLPPTTTTTLPSFEVPCVVTMGVTSDETLGSVQFQMDYSAIDGELVGSAGDAACRSLVDGAFAVFNDDDASRLLLNSTIGDEPFAGPAGIAECDFLTRDGNVAPDDFAFILRDAVNPDFEQVTPVLAVTDIACERVPTTTTTMAPTTTTTMAPTTTTTMAPTTTTTMPPTTTTTMAPTTTTTMPSFEVPCEITLGFTSDETLGSVQFQLDYSAVDGELVGSAGEASCRSLVDAAFAVFNDDDASRLLLNSTIGDEPFAGPAGIAECDFLTRDGSVTPDDFAFILRDAVDPDFQQVTPILAVTNIACEGVPTTTTTMAPTTTTTMAPTTTTTMPPTTTTTSSTTTTTMAIGASRSCSVDLNVDNETILKSLQVDVDYAELPGGFPNMACDVVPGGLVDVRDNRAERKLTVAWTNFSNFETPSPFAACTFVSTAGESSDPISGDFPLTIVDHAGPTPPAPADPAPEVSVATGPCAPVDAECGNGVLESGESCDDGNTDDGDGCSASCAN